MYYSKAELDNYSSQLNQNNDAYWQSRGFDDRPDDWQLIIDFFE